MRVLPNIIITGTPGVGKSAHSEQLARESGLRHLAISQLVIDSGCHSGWDDATESYTVDEAKVCNRL